ncbi:TetR/AcrR family transcriptional regulator [Vibrio tritonius]|uniref:TetR/AcrR family transcriptional regulator n=1 Tax=Vibrio tritonius TaxID=1435069 RepID=A0ABS7YSV3_9VIBR|nr:TetR/AcrR family transcriptional regulator [Vibrio tritonius]MCA2017360.1 TetR/AcrR family transcriptional regulator [Vibrio tritonius]
MRVSKQQAEANRAHIVETSAKLFREKGYNGIGVADLMAQAGFTAGGFYKNFASKTDLMVEATALCFEQSRQTNTTLDKEAFITQYLSPKHRDNTGNGCVFAALSHDAARQEDSVKTLFENGLETFIQSIGANNAAEREQNIALFAQMVGAITLARSCPENSPLADEILTACLHQILGEEKSSESSVTDEE